MFFIRRYKCTGIIGIGTSRFVLYREVLFIRRLKCTGIIGIGTNRFFLYREVFFIQSVLYRRFHCMWKFLPLSLPLPLHLVGLVLRNTLMFLKTYTLPSPPLTTPLLRIQKFIISNTHIHLYTIYILYYIYTTYVHCKLATK